MLTSLSVDQIHLRLQGRLAEAEHAALVREALRGAAPSHAARLHSPLRMRMATALRALACRLDSSLAVAA